MDYINAFEHYINAYNEVSESEKIALIKELAAAAAAFKTISDMFKTEHDVGYYDGVSVTSRTLTDYSALLGICEARNLDNCIEKKVKAAEVKKAVKFGSITAEELALCATTQTKVLSVN